MNMTLQLQNRSLQSQGRTLKYQICHVLYSVTLC